MFLMVAISLPRRDDEMRDRRKPLVNITDEGGSHSIAHVPGTKRKSAQAPKLTGELKLLSCIELMATCANLPTTDGATSHVKRHMYAASRI
jgi:hypothetical protein|mmetsp:Transcript_21418/g.34477  ORF Transcript_21418/g.34477 Transcript_21418/m.34477 type:complete len:91 (-) Transcript_21418:599-871(-)